MNEKGARERNAKQSAQKKNNKRKQQNRNGAKQGFVCILRNSGAETTDALPKMFKFCSTATRT